MFGGMLTEFANTLIDDIATRETVVADVDEEIVDAIRGVVLLRAVLDDALARLSAQAARVGTAKRSGLSDRELLCRNGVAPSAASRYLRVGRAIGVLNGLAGHSRDGSLSSEHVDAIARGIEHVARRTGDPIESELINAVEGTLTAQAIAGSSPAEIIDRARAVAIEHTAADVAPENDATPAAEDPALNEVGYAKTSDGRLRGEFDLDALTAERLVSALDAGSRPRPEPDGSDDPRPAARRRADAFAQLIECGTRVISSDALSSPPRSELILTMPVGATPVGGESAARLQWMGPISDFAATMASCDTAVTGIGHDLNGAPLDVSATRRLFTGAIRKQIEWRDQCCVKCGAPASWTDCHHIVHFADGGPTTVDNGCLLCRACHTAVHHFGWDIVMGHDRHPWLIPPTSVDPRRRPQPAYNRRTMRLDDIPAAA